MVRGGGGQTKRPTSAYGFFVKMCYEEHRKKYPGENVQVTEISRKCSEKWKTMTEAEKRRFYELAQKDTERYHQECQIYGEPEPPGGKRKRQKKDPGAPKRALSAFFFFSNERRPDIAKAHPDWRVGQVAQELGRQWKDMTDEQKKVYEVMATNDRSRYEEEMQQYKGGTYVPKKPKTADAGPSSAMQQQAAPVMMGGGGMPQMIPNHVPQQAQMMMMPPGMMGGEMGGYQPQQMHPQMAPPPQNHANGGGNVEDDEDDGGDDDDDEGDDE